MSPMPWTVCGVYVFFSIAVQKVIKVKFLLYVSHISGYALHEEESGNYQFFTFTDRAEKWNIEQHIEELCSSPRVEAHKVREEMNQI
jgi:hypothetical protein